MKLIPIATKVSFGFNHDLHGTIIGINIRGEDHHPTYQIEWWVGSELNVSEFMPSQVEPLKDSKRVEIGFEK